MSHGLYRSPGSTELEAWQVVLPIGGRFTHLTAAAALGWWLPPVPPDLPVMAAVPAVSTRPARKGLRVVRADPVARPRAREGVCLDAPAEILLNCARDLGLLDLLILVDGALASGDVTVADLRDAESALRRGNRDLRRVIPLADARSESPWESVLRLMHVTCGAEVEPQRGIVDRFGEFVARGDLHLVGTCTIHEYDGAVHLDRGQQHADLVRLRRLTDAGWTRRGYTSRDLLGRPIGILRDIDRALGRPHDPSRIRAWYTLLAQSLLTPAGTQRLRARLLRE